MFVERRDYSEPTDSRQWEERQAAIYRKEEREHDMERFCPPTDNEAAISASIRPESYMEFLVELQLTGL